MSSLQVRSQGVWIVRNSATANSSEAIRSTRCLLYHTRRFASSSGDGCTEPFSLSLEFFCYDSPIHFFPVMLTQRHQCSSPVTNWGKNIRQLSGDEFVEMFLLTIRWFSLLSLKPFSTHTCQFSCCLKWITVNYIIENFFFKVRSPSWTLRIMSGCLLWCDKTTFLLCFHQRHSPRRWN